MFGSFDGVASLCPASYYFAYLCKKIEANHVLNVILGLGQLLVLGNNVDERYLFV